MAHALFGKKVWQRGHGSILRFTGYNAEHMLGVVRAVMEEANLDQIRAELAIVGLIRGMTEALCRGHPVVLPGFAAFAPMPYKERRFGHWPKHHKSPPWIRNMHVLAFMAGSLKREVNDRCPHTDAHVHWLFRWVANTSRRNGPHAPNNGYGRGSTGAGKSPWTTTSLDFWVRRGIGKYLPRDQRNPEAHQMSAREMDDAIERDRRRLDADAGVGNG
jgi:nucleoid DNA-binding protein